MIDSALDPLDIARGMVTGFDPAVGALEPRTELEPRPALTEVLTSALRRPPCLVSFSGGRDSSALLALAVAVARAEGLPAPIPATMRFPRHPQLEESAWQELVLDHLGISERVVLELDSELDLLGEHGTRFLAAHGLRYPPNTHMHALLLAEASGGSLVSGTGGDELLSPHLLAGPSMVVYGHQRPRGAWDVAKLLASGLPAAIRGRLAARALAPSPPWLTPRGQDLLAARFASWLGADPLRFDRHLRSWWWRSRYFTHGTASFQLLASDYRVHYTAPFMDPLVLDAIARARGGRGFPDRTAAMTLLFGDLLPDDVVRRTTKATFGPALVGPATR